MTPSGYVPPRWFGQLVISSARSLRWRRTKAFEAIGSGRFSATAQHGMDRFIADLVGEGGYFIEAGANDGFRMSNTYLLEERYGWKGLLVEPIPQLAALCASRRPHSKTFQCALVAEETEGETIEIQYADGQSVVGGGISHDDWSVGASWGLEESYMLHVPTRTLTGLLDEVDAPAKPDLLSLDVEGYEPQVLAGLNLARYRPRYVLVEAWVEDLPSFGVGFNANYELVKKFPGKNLLLAAKDSDGPPG